MDPRQNQRAAQAIRGSCKKYGVQLPASVSALQLVKAAQNLSVLNKLKDLTAEEAKRIAAAVSGESAEQPP